MSNLNLIIMPRCDLPDAKSKFNCDHVISIFEPKEKGTKGDPTPDGVSPSNHSRFYFTDTNDHRSLVDPPTKEDIQFILDKYPSIVGQKTFVHCFAGISRSSATVFALYCRDLGPGKEAEAMRLTERSAPYGGIWPNKLITKYADEILEREGRMIVALEAWMEMTFRVNQEKRAGIWVPEDDDDNSLAIS